MRNGRHAFVPWLIRLAIDGQQLQIFGDGQQMRDFTYVDDVVEALLAAACRRESDGEVFNLGGERPYSIHEFVDILLGVVGGGSYACTPFPRPASNRHWELLRRFFEDQSVLDWQPARAADRSLRRTVEYTDVIGTTTGETAGSVSELCTQYPQVKAEIDRAIQSVLDCGVFVFGGQVAAFERGVRSVSGVPYAVGVSSGTDALRLALLGAGIGPGDEVITSALTAVATWSPLRTPVPG